MIGLEDKVIVGVIATNDRWWSVVSVRHGRTGIAVRKIRWSVRVLEQPDCEEVVVSVLRVR